MTINDRTDRVAKQFLIKTRRDASRGEVVYKVCFAAGTLVHTDQGLVPIEKIRVGTRVLSQPEDGGERAYRRVTNPLPPRLAVRRRRCSNGSSEPRSRPASAAA